MCALTLMKALTGFMWRLIFRQIVSQRALCFKSNIEKVIYFYFYFFEVINMFQWIFRPVLIQSSKPKSLAIHDEYHDSGPIFQTVLAAGPAV